MPESEEKGNEEPFSYSIPTRAGSSDEPMRGMDRELVRSDKPDTTLAPGTLYTGTPNSSGTINEETPGTARTDRDDSAVPPPLSGSGHRDGYAPHSPGSAQPDQHTSSPCRSPLQRKYPSRNRSRPSFYRDQTW